MKSLSGIVFLATALLSTLVVSDAQVNLNKAKLDSLLDVYEQKNKLMVTLAISQNSQTIYSRATGYALNENNKQVKSNINTKYRIGSISKTYTAVMILQLVEAKKLKLSTSLSKFFPKLLNAKKITIEQLLKHRTGLHNFTEDPEYLTYMNSPKTTEELLDIFMKLPSDFEPGEKHVYSNTNYVLLGMIVEKITKKSYSDNLKERIIDKIGLKNTYVGDKADILKNEARSFRFNGKEWITETETDMSVPRGAGAIVSTAEDLTDFAEALFNYKLLKKETVDQMAIQQEGYGMGVFTIPFYDKVSIGHNGRLDGFESVMAYFQNEQLAVCLSSNGVNSDGNEFLVGVLSILFDMPYQLPKFYTYDVPATILDEYQGTYYCEMMKLEFYVTKEGNVIVGQAAAQPAFPLDAISETTFGYAPASLEIVFKRNISNQVDQFILKQSGMEFVFLKLK